jgi:hypothetical protein
MFNFGIAVMAPTIALDPHAPMIAFSAEDNDGWLPADVVVPEVLIEDIELVVPVEIVLEEVVVLLVVAVAADDDVAVSAKSPNLSTRSSTWSVTYRLPEESTATPCGPSFSNGPPNWPLPEPAEPSWVT